MPRPTRLTPPARRRPSRPQLLTAGAAALTTSAAVALGVLATGPADSSDAVATDEVAAAATAAQVDAATEDRTEDRAIGTSRSAERRPALQPRVPTVKRQLWTTAPLELRTQPGQDAPSAGTFPDDQQIGVTGKRTDGYAEVLVDGAARWVSASYLAREKQPDTGVDAAVNYSPCGKSASGGLQDRAQRVMNAVCHAFPQVTTYGGQAGRGEHGTGLAIDIMVRGETGDQIRDFLMAHRGEFGLSNIIWEQTIWSAQRGGEGFRSMENRGGDTANHFDHVHVLVD